jgi:LacI family transcriptional regulator
MTKRGAGASRSPKAVGIKDIARALDVSIGTVDRALHERPGINPMTRAKVLKMAKTMGYRPNLAARFLKSQKQLRIVALLPTHIESFFEPLRNGLEEAAIPFEPAVHVEYLSYRWLSGDDVALFEKALDTQPNGMIIVPGHPVEVKALIRKAAKQNVPVVCVATDASGTERLTSVSADPRINGAIVGELLARMRPNGGPVAFFTGDLSTEDHADKLEGFSESLATYCPSLTIAKTIEAHDDEEFAYGAAQATLKERPDLAAIYVSTANSVPVLKAVEESGREDLTIITTDLFPELVPHIRNGRVLATIYQRPRTQGRLAFQSLRQFLLEGTCPPPRMRLAPHIVMRSNLPLFTDQLALEDESPEESPRIGSWSREEAPALRS